MQEATRPLGSPITVPMPQRSFILPALLALFSIYAAVGLSGYSGDADGYGLLRTGRTLFLEGTYFPSRQPGYLVPEIAIGGLSLLGGAILTNLASAILGTITLLVFWRLLKSRLSGREATLAVLMAGLTPNFVLAASSSMDYVYGLFFGILGTLAMTKGRYWVAAPLFALALSSRLSNALVVSVIYAYPLLSSLGKRDFAEARRILASGVLTLCLVVLAFVPSYFAYDRTFGFFSYAIGDWSWAGYLSRFVYKNVYLFGLPAFLSILGACAWALIRGRVRSLPFPLALGGATLVALQEILFLKVPLEISYLLPVLFVIFPMLVVMFRSNKRFLYGILGMVMIQGFVLNIDVLDKKYDSSGQEALSAEVGIFAHPGAVISDIQKRRKTDAEYRHWLKGGTGAVD